MREKPASEVKPGDWIVLPEGRSFTKLVREGGTARRVKAVTRADHLVTIVLPDGDRAILKWDEVVWVR